MQQDKTARAATREQQLVSGVGLKFDHDKPRYDLLPSLPLHDVALILTYGAQKYGDRNWENGIHFSRLFAATMRHLWSWWRGEEHDSESGFSHLAHAAVNILFMLHFQNTKQAEWDDRPKHG